MRCFVVKPSPHRMRNTLQMKLLVVDGIVHTEHVANRIVHTCCEQNCSHSSQTNQVMLELSNIWGGRRRGPGGWKTSAFWPEWCPIFNCWQKKKILKNRKKIVSSLHILIYVKKSLCFVSLLFCGQVRIFCQPQIWHILCWKIPAGFEFWDGSYVLCLQRSFYE